MFEAMESVQKYFGTIYTGACIAWIEGQFGYVSGISSINASEFRSYDIESRYHSHDYR